MSEPLDSSNCCKWVHCFCVVTFDLELGQAIEVIYPPNADLSEKEKLNICYLSFPDSNTGCMGDTTYHFRIRRSPNGNYQQQDDPLKDYNEKCPMALQTNKEYLFGYVFFRQMKDKNIRRGYFQKSVVLISSLPFVSLYSFIIGLIAPNYFENGLPSLEAAYYNVLKWPNLLPGGTLNLPLIGSIIQVRIPSRSDKLLLIANQNKTQPIFQEFANILLPSVYEVDVFCSFKPIISNLQLLWELVITEEPIVVMSTNPTSCSKVIQALVSSIWPLRYPADYRPYFTIHDSEFKEFTTADIPPRGVILGVTNPFFVKTLQNWPHVVHIGDSSETSTRTISKFKKSSNKRIADFHAGVYTSYVQQIRSDKDLMKKLFKGTPNKRPTEVQSAIIRRHFLELTQSFMIPLERYIGSLMPLAKDIGPLKATPNLREFVQDNFIASLSQSGPQLTSSLKGNWVSLYKKFLSTSIFEHWFRYRTREIHIKLQLLHTESIAHYNFQRWLIGKSELEMVDMYLRLKSIKKEIEDINCEKTDNLSKRLQDIMHQFQLHFQSDLLSILN